MDLYFHTSPKKRMLNSFKKKRISSSVVPEQQQEKKIVLKSVLVTDYLQKKVASIHTKRIWKQMLPYSIRQKTIGSTKTSSTVLFDSNEHLKTVSAPPTPPPKKSHTMPNLVIITDKDQLIQRALPILPTLPSISSETSLSIGEKKNTLTRATTWVGNSIQRWLSTADAEERRKMAILMDHSELDEEEEQSILYSSTLMTSTLSQRMTLHCRILQITNLASSKNYQYTMNMRTTNNAAQTHTGVMKKVTKGISAAHPRVALSFDVQGRFQLECNLNIKPCSSTNFVHRIKSLASRTNLSSEEQDDDDENEICMQGHLVLDSGDEPLSSFANKGIGRYSIQTTNQLALELTAAFWLEENNDYIEEDDVHTPIDQEVLKYCQAGDYLTIYVKGESFPMWVRYWVAYKNNQLVLRLNERGKGEPVDTIGLKWLNKVNINPSDDIQEEIYLGKKYGMILSFGKQDMYMFADNCKSLRYWKCLLEQQKSVTARQDNKIAKKYLWVAQ